MKTLRIVSVSGGKDSTALYIWAIRRFGRDGFKAVFADTGNEHPVTLNYIRNLPEMAGGPPIKWVKADFEIQLDHKGIEPTDSVFLDLCLVKGRVPSSKAQFCTENLKMAPIRDWLLSEAKGRKIISFTGIRAGESKKRSGYAAAEFLPYYPAWTVRPLLRWTEEQVFSYLDAADVPPNPLYEAGFSRVGCFPCIHARKAELVRMPDDAWAKIAAWEDRIGRSWFAAGTIPPTPQQKMDFDAIRARNPKPAGEEDDWRSDEEQAYINENMVPTVAEVRDWCKTVRGGVQYDLLVPEPAEVMRCMSAWNVCE